MDQQNKAGYTAIMLTMLAASRSESDMETIMQLLKVGNVNAKASQVPERAAAGSLPKASPFDQLGVLRSGNFSTLGGGGGHQIPILSNHHAHSF